MEKSIFNLYSIGVGPSSSHTVGPMKAAKVFLEKMKAKKKFESIESLSIILYGSLAMTGKGHGTDTAIILGLLGEDPKTIDSSKIPSIIRQLNHDKKLKLLGEKSIGFDRKKHLLFEKETRLPYHSNGMKIQIFDNEKKLIDEQVYYSIGGGTIVEEENTENFKKDSTTSFPYPYHSVSKFLEMGKKGNLKISEMVMKNEECLRTKKEIEQELDGLWEVMKDSVNRGKNTPGVLPGGPRLPRRAPELFQKLKKEESNKDPLKILDYVSLYALAVNEENAVGGRIVTAPTNGAAGVLPAVMHYYDCFIPNSNQSGIRSFLLAAGGIGIFYKLHASISGSEVGCQGEVGVACSMAAGALTEVLGGTIEQVENAAEIGMEHNLGLTCDPIGGLVQIPCIERNAMAAVKAINASRLALMGSGKHFISLEKIIKTMLSTGKDMQDKYKETSLGGLAVNIPEC